jgi:hypothetical protein
MKIIIGCFFVLCLQLQSNAQNSLIGRWKLTQVETPEIGLVDIDLEKIKQNLFNESIERNDSSLNMEDTLYIIKNAESLYKTLSKTKITFTKGKTFTGQFGDEITNGTYFYDKVKKTLTTKSAKKPAKTSKISFKDGRLLMSDPKTGVVSYFTKVE